MSLIDDLMAVVAVIISSNWIQLNRGTTGVINLVLLLLVVVVVVVVDVV